MSELSEIKQDIRHTRDTAVGIGKDVARIGEAIKLHMENKEIHHLPYCAGLRSVSNRMWAMLLLALSAAGAAIASLVGK